MDIPREIYAWECRDDDYYNGTGFYENGFMLNPNLTGDLPSIKYIRADIHEATLKQNEIMREALESIVDDSGESFETSASKAKQALDKIEDK